MHRRRRRRRCRACAQSGSCRAASGGLPGWKQQPGALARAGGLRWTPPISGRAGSGYPGACAASAPPRTSNVQSFMLAVSVLPKPQPRNEEMATDCAGRSSSSGTPCACAPPAAASAASSTSSATSAAPPRWCMTAGACAATRRRNGACPATVGAGDRLPRVAFISVTVQIKRQWRSQKGNQA